MGNRKVCDQVYRIPPIVRNAAAVGRIFYLTMSDSPRQEKNSTESAGVHSRALTNTRLRSIVSVEDVCFLGFE